MIEMIKQPGKIEQICSLCYKSMIFLVDKGATRKIAGMVSFQLASSSFLHLIFEQTTWPKIKSLKKG